MTKSPVIPPTPTAAQYNADTRGGEDVFTSDDPFVLFERWLADAGAAEPNDANAMALATVDGAGLPNVRMVLLKDVTAGGFSFYTNDESAKGVEIAAIPKAALCFHWKSLRRQIRIRGEVIRISDAEVDDYFAKRAREARIGAWASSQSRPLADRQDLLTSVDEWTQKFEGGDVGRPPYWGGYRIAPVEIEFWMDRPYRLHERRVFRRETAGGAWTMMQLYP